MSFSVRKLIERARYLVEGAAINATIRIVSFLNTNKLKWIGPFQLEFNENRMNKGQDKQIKNLSNGIWNEEEEEAETYKETYRRQGVKYRESPNRCHIQMNRKKCNAFTLILFFWTFIHWMVNTFVSGHKQFSSSCITTLAAKYYGKTQIHFFLSTVIFLSFVWSIVLHTNYFRLYRPCWAWN